MAKRIQLAEKNYQQKIKLGKQIDKYITENKISSLVLDDDDSEALKLYNNSKESWDWPYDDVKVVPRRRILPDVRKRSRSKDSRRSLGNDIFGDNRLGSSKKVGVDIAEGLARYESLTDLSKRNVVISE